MPIMEDEHGTHILNSKDLRAVEHVDRLTRIGVDSLKIEGRKASTTWPARPRSTAAPSMTPWLRPFNPELLLGLETLASRGYTGGLRRRPAQDYQNYITGSSELHRSHFVGEVTAVRGTAGCRCRPEPVRCGRLYRAVASAGQPPHRRAQEMQNLDGEPVRVAPGDPVRVWILGAPAEGGFDRAAAGRP